MPNDFCFFFLETEIYFRSFPLYTLNQSINSHAQYDILWYTVRLESDIETVKI